MPFHRFRARYRSSGAVVPQPPRRCQPIRFPRQFGFIEVNGWGIGERRGGRDPGNDHRLRPGGRRSLERGLLRVTDNRRAGGGTPALAGRTRSSFGAPRSITEYALKRNLFATNQCIPQGCAGRGSCRTRRDSVVRGLQLAAHSVLDNLDPVVYYPAHNQRAHHTHHEGRRERPDEAPATTRPYRPGRCQFRQRTLADEAR